MFAFFGLGAQEIVLLGFCCLVGVVVPLVLTVVLLKVYRAPPKQVRDDFDDRPPAADRD